MNEAYRVEALDDLGSTVGRVGVDHEDLVAPQERFEAVTDMDFLVERGDDHGDLGTLGGVGRTRFGHGLLLAGRSYRGAGVAAA